MLSAFLDGTLTDDERALVLREIAADRERYARFVEIVQLRAGLDAEEATQAMGSARSERRTTTPAASPQVAVAARTTTRSPLATRLLAPLVLAAALIGIVVFMRNANVEATRDVASVLQVAQLVEVPTTRGNGAIAQSLGAAGMDPKWSVLRGGDTGQRASARAYRAGVRIAQMEIAMRALDSSAARLASDGLQELLRDVPGAAPLSASLSTNAAAGNLPDKLTRTTVSQQVRALTGATAWYDLGVWTESARHAAKRPQPDFFKPGTVPIQQLATLLTQLPDDAPWREATAPLREFLAPPAAGVSLDAMVRALDAVAMTAGG